MQERDTKWTPMKALGKAQKEVDSLGLPVFEKLEERQDLHFPNISDADNKELEAFLTMYGGYKAYMETNEIPLVEETQIDLPVTAFIPGDWITDNDEKIAAYRSAAECSTKELLVELATIWSDRYGTIPKAVQTLLEIMKLKLLAKQCGFSRIKQIKKGLRSNIPGS